MRTKPQLATVRYLERRSPWGHDCPTPCRKYVERIIDACKQDPKLRDVHDVVFMMFSLGLRVNEVRQLHWKQIDLEKGRIEIPATASFPSSYVALSEDASATFGARHEHSKDSDLVLGVNPFAALFRVMLQFSKLATSLGMTPVPLHWLRQSFLAHMAAAGQSASRIAELGRCHAAYAERIVAHFGPAVSAIPTNC